MKQKLQKLRVYLGRHEPPREPGGRRYTSCSDLTDHPQYTNETMDNTKDFIPEVFIKARPDIPRTKGLLLETSEERARLMKLGFKPSQVELAFIVVNNLDLRKGNRRNKDGIR